MKEIKSYEDDDSYGFLLRAMIVEQKLNLHPKKFGATLLGIAVFFSIFSLVVWYIPRRFQISIGRMYELFFVDNENNFPTFFSVLLFLICALLLLYIYYASKSEVGKHQHQWIILAIGFFYLACDDFMVLHEKLTKPTNVLLRSLNLGGLIKFSWVIPAILFIVIAAAYFVPFIIKLPRKTLIIFVLSAVIFLSGAIGLEMIGGEIKATFGSWSREYAAEASVEEFLEMVGPIGFIYGLLDYISIHFRKLGITVISESTGKNE